LLRNRHERLWQESDRSFLFRDLRDDGGVVILPLELDTCIGVDLILFQEKA